MSAFLKSALSQNKKLNPMGLAHLAAKYNILASTAYNTYHKNKNNSKYITSNVQNKTNKCQTNIEILKNSFVPYSTNFTKKTKHLINCINWFTQ